jgi:predicted NBD/HSP70 family sugar kinase
VLAKKRQNDINFTMVLRTIWLQRGISRSEIARVLGLDKSTVTNLVVKLMDLAIVSEMAEGQSSPLGGRKPVYLCINKKYGCVLGFEMKPDMYTAVAVNLEGEILFTRSEKVIVKSSHMVEVFFDLLERIQGDLNRTGLPLIGIGVGVSGLVNPVKGQLIQSILFHQNKPIDFVEDVATKLDLPVFLENDANCCVLGELAFHRTALTRNFLFVLVEFVARSESAETWGGVVTGIGIVINGQLHYGNDYAAGEFTSVYWEPPNLGQFSLSDEEMLMIEQEQKIRLRFIRELSKNLAVLVNTFNLGHIFIGGAIEKYQSEISPILQEELERNCSYPDHIKWSIHYSSFGDKAVAYGAAGMLLERLFAVPQIADVGKTPPFDWNRLFTRIAKQKSNHLGAPEHVRI